MNAEWQSFLEQSGANFEDGHVRDFGNPDRELEAAATGNVVADIGHLGVVAVEGEDAAQFLQSQTSNDIREVSDTRSQLNAYCSPKGRILTSFRIFQRGEIFYLRMPADMLEPTVKRLGMYVLMSRVTLDDASEEVMRVGCAGPDMEDILKATTGVVPAAVNDVVHTRDLSIIRVPDNGQPRYEVFGDIDSVRALWRGLVDSATAIGTPAWELLEVRAGVPNIYPTTTDAFVPQMVNLQAIDGVSFRKGCYPGQEVVARMQYLGKLKRRMYRAHIHTDKGPMPGDTLYAANAEGGQGAGRIVEAQPSPEGGFEALTVMQINLEGEEVRLHDADGPVLEFRDLPYPVELPQE